MRSPKEQHSLSAAFSFRRPLIGARAVDRTGGAIRTRRRLLCARTLGFFVRSVSSGPLRHDEILGENALFLRTSWTHVSNRSPLGGGSVEMHCQLLEIGHHPQRRFANAKCDVDCHAHVDVTAQQRRISSADERVCTVCQPSRRMSIDPCRFSARTSARHSSTRTSIIVEGSVRRLHMAAPHGMVDIKACFLACSFDRGIWSFQRRDDVRERPFLRRSDKNRNP